MYSFTGATIAAITCWSDLNCGFSHFSSCPSQLAELRSQSASVKTLQGAVQALEEEKAKLQEHVHRLENELSAGPNTSNSSGKSELTSVLIPSTDVIFCEVSLKFTHCASAIQRMQL